MKKMVGYIVMLLGVALILVKFFGSRFGIGLPDVLSGNVGLIVALALIVVGVFLTWQRVRQAEEEVPIYHGREIIGYRRH